MSLLMWLVVIEDIALTYLIADDYRNDMRAEIAYWKGRANGP